MGHDISPLLYLHTLSLRVPCAQSLIVVLWHDQAQGGVYCSWTYLRDTDWHVLSNDVPNSRCLLPHLLLELLSL